MRGQRKAKQPEEQADRRAGDDARAWTSDQEACTEEVAQLVSTYDDPSYLRSEIRKRSADGEATRLLLAAVDAGAPARLTRNGIVFHAPSGTVGAHWTPSDRRAALNLEAQFRRAGVDLPRLRPERSMGAAPSKRRTARRPKPVRVSFPAPPYEAPRAPQTYTLRAPAPEVSVPVAPVSPPSKDRVSREEAARRREQWTMGQARSLVRQGYAPERVSVMTGWPLSDLEDADAIFEVPRERSGLSR